MVDLDSQSDQADRDRRDRQAIPDDAGALTTFSIANDVAKYFAIIPAAFATNLPRAGALNIMHLATPGNAVMSAVIFNALLRPALIPAGLRGIKFRAIAERHAEVQPVEHGLGGRWLRSSASS